MPAKLHEMEPGLYVFHCPGCGYGHHVRVSSSGALNPQWNWNGSIDSPTFSPSLLVNKDYPENRCHCFVEDGRIRFLADCWHPLAGKIVDLPDWEDWNY
jgi:hypothetical protein